MNASKRTLQRLYDRNKWIEAQQERLLGPVTTKPWAGCSCVDEKLIATVVGAVREAIALLPPDEHGQVEIQAAHLAVEVSRRGHPLPAIAWALHRMVQTSELTAHVCLSLPRPDERHLPRNVRLYPGLDYDTNRNMRVPFGAYRVRTNPGFHKPSLMVGQNTASNADVRITQAQREIIDVIRENGQLTTNGVLDALSAKALLPSPGNTKGYLAELVRRGILVNERPNGYRLADSQS